MILKEKILKLEGELSDIKTETKETHEEFDQ
jgi:hypothetical protein